MCSPFLTQRRREGFGKQVLQPTTRHPDLKWRPLPDNVFFMTVRQLSVAATVLGVVAVIFFILGRPIVGVVFILLAGGAWTLTQYVRVPRGRDDDGSS